MTVTIKRVPNAPNQLECSGLGMLAPKNGVSHFTPRWRDFYRAQARANSTARTPVENLVEKLFDIDLHSVLITTSPDSEQSIILLEKAEGREWNPGHMAIVEATLYHYLFDTTTGLIR